MADREIKRSDHLIVIKVPSNKWLTPYIVVKYLKRRWPFVEAVLDTQTLAKVANKIDNEILSETMPKNEMRFANGR